ncbi:hypothetical protein ES705_43523 [subsurface metagenome]
MQAENLKKPAQHIGLAQTRAQPTNQVLQPFRVATVAAAMEISTALASTVTGGVLLSTVPISPGGGACTTIAAMYTGTTTVRVMVFLCAVSGILKILV